MNGVIFLFGCLGAAASEIIRLYRKRFISLHLKSPKFYIFISLAFCLIGGVVAIILPATTKGGAFYAGASWPMLISGTLSKSPPSSPEDDTELNSGHFIPGGAQPKKRTLKFREYLNI